MSDPFTSSDSSEEDTRAVKQRETLVAPLIAFTEFKATEHPEPEEESTLDRQLMNSKLFRSTSNCSSQDTSAEMSHRLAAEKAEFVRLYRAHAEVRPGDEWSLVSTRWFKKWQRHVGLTSAEGFEDLPFAFPSAVQVSLPGPIVNIDLLDREQTKLTLADPAWPFSKGVVHNSLVENVDYVLLPPECFEFLKVQYGCGLEIHRKAIEVDEDRHQIEVFLKQVRVVCPSKEFHVHMMQVSRKSTLSSLKTTFLKANSLRQPCRVWKVDLTTTSLDRLRAICQATHPVYLIGGKLLSESLLIDDCEITTEDLLLLEPRCGSRFLYSEDPSVADNTCGYCQKDSDLLLQCQKCGFVKYCSAPCQKHHAKEHRSECKPPYASFLYRCFCRAFNTVDDDADSDEEDQRKPLKYSRQGLTGLQNLGNTCFMNSALQCLSHTTELTHYFLTDKFQKHVNQTNPLGSKGKLAFAYNEVVQHLWHGKSSSFAPWKLKKVLSQFAPQFLGYHQHDSHELLSFLLDGLHEDLNLVKKKPFYADDSAFKGRSLDEIAQLSWTRHVSRNQSIFVDLMHGQYKSTLYCPCCGNYSYAFDPFSSLSLPIPVGTCTRVVVYFVFADAQLLPKRLECCGQFVTARDLRGEIAAQLNVSLESFYLAGVRENAIDQFFQDDFELVRRRSKVVFAYEHDLSEQDKTPVEVRIMLEGFGSLQAYSRLVFVNSETSFKEVHHKVFNKVKPYIKDLSSEESLEGQDVYTLHYANQRYAKCPECQRLSCRGCILPYDDSAFTLKYLALRWKRAAVKHRVNLDKLNDFQEVESKPKRGRTGIDIAECLRCFSQPEKLDRSNAWYCAHCKRHVEATKKLEIYKVPEILVIQLKRFKLLGYHREKINQPIEFPENGLDLSEFVIGHSPGVYDLYAVSSHYGSLGGGHYTAQCFSQAKAAWVEFDDSAVSGHASVSASSAYILFYRRRPTPSSELV